VPPVPRRVNRRAARRPAARRCEPHPCAILAGLKRFAVFYIAVAAIAAIALFMLGASTTTMALGIALIGCAAVGAVSLAFLAVGQAEDRERAEAAAAREPKRDPKPAQAPRPAEDPHPRRTLGLGPDRRRQRPPRRPG
jgi:hypothetical protein